MIYQTRQKFLLSQVRSDDCIICIHAGDQPNYQKSHIYPAHFRVNSNFYYLCGGRESGHTLLLLKREDKTMSILLYQHQSVLQQRWGDQQIFIDCLKSQTHHYDFIEKYEKFDFKKIISTFFGSQAISVFYYDGISAVCPQWDWIASREAIGPLIAQQRLIKDSDEIQLMRESVYRSSLVHRDLSVHRFTIPKEELRWQAAWLFYGARHGLFLQGYQPIIAGGPRACCLHYNKNNHSLRGDDRVLVDAGFEYQGYCADITRMYFLGPHANRWKEIYESLLAIQKKIISQVRPGMTIALLQESTKILIAQMIVDYRWTNGSVEKVLEQEILDYYPHQIGHHLGLDVHDFAAYRELYHVPLEPGMVVTIEPGLYIDPKIFKTEHPCLGLGMRIEDNILVTDKAPEILSAAAPKEWIDIGSG